MGVRVRRPYIGEKRVELQWLLEIPFHRKSEPLWQEAAAFATIHMHRLNVLFLQAQSNAYQSSLELSMYFTCLLNDHCRTWCHGLMTFFSLHSSWPLLDWARPYLWTTLETDCPSPGKLRTASSCPRVETNHWALDEPGDHVWEPCSMGINTARVTLSRATCLHWEHGRKPSCEV